MKSLEDLNVLREKLAGKDTKNKKRRIVVGMATCGIAAGARPVMEAFAKIEGKDVTVGQVGCIGICHLEPIAEVYEVNGEKTTYVKMTAERADEIIEKHIKGGKPVTEYTIGYELEDRNMARCFEQMDFYKKQKRVALRNCGLIDPENIDDYILTGGYSALGKVLSESTPAEVVDVVKKSGLRGRGGAGFPTGLKWEFTYKATSEDGVKYVACNADEGDPGAFMDRSVLEGDPHALLEAMAIAGYAVSAQMGYIYIRAEYPVAVKRLKLAIKQAKEYGLFGNNIFGTDFCFDIEIRLGAGAFVCGEETALIRSIEGFRGEPRPRPPFPAVKGIFGKPTLLNNVETYASITQIILNGADWFRSFGSEKSPGTKVFAVGGKINNTGLVEVPIGTTLREVVYDICGGIPNGKKFKAAQTGGPSGGCIPVDHLDTPIDYETLTAIGSMMGSGGLIVMDEDNCMVDIAKYFLEFTVDESCGKCPPCRIGTKRMYEILERITEGKSKPDDVEKLQVLASSIKASALCALGQSAPNPVLSTIRYFKDEYNAHVNDFHCPAHSCKALKIVTIDEHLCKGCGVCKKVCPVGAIVGERKALHTIDQSKCTKCGACHDKCAFDAILIS